MFAVGHLAIGYLTAKTLAKLLQTEIDIPTVMMLSIIMDIDLLVPKLLHRGPTHSLIIIGLASIPLFFLKGKSIFPYLLALAQHSFIGDFLTGDGVTAFWPLSHKFYGLGVKMLSFTNVLAEGSAFLAAFTLLLLSKDITTMFNPKKTSLLLIFPLGTVFPVIIGQLAVPTELLIPHYLLFILLSGVLIIWIKNVIVNNLSLQNK
jgi:membrane-bound metal-dependent hydrolase YbcI (DUF457 family)